MQLSTTNNLLSLCLVLCAAAIGCIGCSSTPKYADYVGNPVDMNNCCARAATVCPKGDDWIACRDDLSECHRLGLWFEAGIKVSRDSKRAHAIFESMCDRFEMSSCGKLCAQGDAGRCVDRALLGIAGAGGRPFPPNFEARDRATFGTACRAGDDVACLMLEVNYVAGSQTVVRRVNNCLDDHARCFATACDQSDPLGCALLCHIGDSRACSQLGKLALRGTGFNKPMVQVASRLLQSRCSDKHDEAACTTLAVASHKGRSQKPSSEGASNDLEEEYPSPQYAFELTEGRAGAIPRPAPPPQRHVGEGLWSGWKHAGNIEGGSFGFTPVVTRTVGESHRSTHASGLVGFFSEIYMQSWYPSHDKYLRFKLAGAIGGGSAGVDGQVSHDAMGGFRLPFSTERSNPFSGTALYQSMSGKDQDALDSAIFTHSPHALFVRGGYGLRYSAVGPWLSSAVELPRVEAGYHFEGESNGLRALELRTSAALLLAGRFNVGDDVRPLAGAVAWGAGMVMHTRRAHVQLGAQRIQAAFMGDRPAVHRLDTNSCLRVVARDERHYKYLVCLQEVLESGEVGAGKGVTAWQTGVFLGLDGLD